MSEITKSGRYADATWIIPFFMIITSALGFFFWQMAQYNLLPH
jgi:hypothetical protein